ncbi:hypothetical protein COT75_04190 [Candidatus Beckwithbacteria bacterium CG10_big_fil_rev_8_21_14_0_10_34_10]|uniref:Uncharacterized protein n=1 Tax=Candidatus Beckwithbacteria bacterium CG10_big_fil_rev_8_21_14_0_10_34_10 TaxID=1974495 RepID=A0A2H0W8D2_9BACT|nr:MAG: hypothetical protein COT75_04190 [Candidatus Beckwithbacteria bacterium CG10_big_fil_rev_8_21_14_0_10_34_10]
MDESKPEINPLNEDQIFLADLEEKAYNYLNVPTSLALLFFTKSEFFYPLSDPKKLEPYIEERDAHKDLVNKQTILKLMELSKKDNPQAKQFLRAFLPRYIDISLPSGQRGYRGNDKEFEERLSNLANRKDKKNILGWLGNRQQKGENLWRSYIRLKNPLIKIESGITEAEIKEQNLIFDTVERMDSQATAELLFSKIKILKKLGFQSIDQYLELMTGQSPEETKQDILKMIKLLKQIPENHGEKTDYFLKERQVLKGLNLNVDPQADPTDLLQKSLEELGIDKDDFQKKVAIITENLAPELLTAGYFYISRPPQLKNNYPGLEDSAAWQLVKNFPVIITTPGNFNHPEEYRYLNHEFGHALEIFLSLKDNQSFPLLISGRPIPLKEVFSLFQESRMPAKGYFQARQKFLITKYAGLILHELNVWQEAEKVVNNGEKGKDKANFFKEMEASYQENVGEALNCFVPTGRFLGDRFNVNQTPLEPANYAYGIVIAALLRKIVDKAASTEDKNQILSQAVKSLNEKQSPKEFLASLGADWNEALNSLKLLFNI